MRQRNHGFLSLVIASALLAVLGCGGGGSSSSGTVLPVTSAAPTVALLGWTPADASLRQYTSYTFSASATDPNIGGTISEFQWDFGDGTKRTVPALLAGGKATASVAYSYVTSGTPTLSVVAKNAAGLLSTAATRALTVAAAPSPLTVAFTVPTGALTINPALGGSYSVTFQINVVNTGSGTISASGVVLDPGDPLATVATPVDLGSGDWRIIATYPAASTISGTTPPTYTPTVKVTDSNGISGAVATGPLVTVKTVSLINNPPVVTMTATPKIIAGVNSTWQNVAIDFKATATDPDGDTLTYSWTFGDGGTGDVAPTQAVAALSQSHTYATAGIYPVIFTANDGRTGGLKTISLNLNILANSAPTLALVQAPAGQPYANVPMTFTANVADADGDVPTITWDFGDTGTGTGSSIVHSFAGAGTTVVKATANDGKGGITVTTLVLDVLTNFPPVSRVTTSPISLYQNKEYVFTASATDPDAGNTITQFQWDFGDNTGIQNSSPSTSTSIKHTYASTFTGNANVRVRAVDNHGSTGDFSPAVTFPVLATSLPVGIFLNPPAAATYNTETSAAGVTVAYIVSMTNPNGTGFLPISALSFAPGESVTTATVLNSTDNGNGTYTYQVRYQPAASVGSRIVIPTIVATDLQGISGTLKSGGPVTINTQAANTPPVVTFTSASTPSAATNATWQGVEFTFTGNATDADSDPLTYTLTFGETGGVGDVTTTPVASGGAISAKHTYAAAGVYTATLTVSDGRTLGTKTITLNMNVLANAAPVVTLANTPVGTTQYANVPVTFSATVTDANSDPTTLIWNFGDGTALVTNQNPVTHSFTAAGTTVVKASANDGKGGVTTATTTLTIQPNLPPVSTITKAGANLYQMKAYTFTASATDPDGNEIFQYQWDFGDNTGIQNSAPLTPTTTTTINHTYSSTFTGNASVKVRAVDRLGSTGDFSPAVVFPVVATPLPVVTFTTPAIPTSLNVDLSPATVTQAFTFAVTNPRSGSGATITGIDFQTIDPSASVISTISNGGGSYTYTVRYTGAAAAGGRTFAPTASATDSLGIQSLVASGPLMTVNTLGLNHAPSIVITTPSSPTLAAFTSKAVSLVFSLTDQDDDPVTYAVDWGDGTATQSATTSTSTKVGAVVNLAHTYADAFGTSPATVAVTATDNRNTTPTAVPQSRVFQVSFNTLPTATITTPQASAVLPLLASIVNGGQGLPTIPSGGTDPDVVVIPAYGKLTFEGTGTAPASGGNLSYAWTFNGGVPSTSSQQHPGEIVFPGVTNQIVAYRVDLIVSDDMARPSVNPAKARSKWVIVDGSHTQDFTLSFMYRQKSDSNLNLAPTVATKAANGLSTQIEIFQDGITNTWKVEDATKTQAIVAIPVRSDIPFWIKIPSGIAGDSRAYFMRIPNAPSGIYADASLGSTLDATTSSFGFASGTAPWNPTLQIVTAQGFAPEVDAAAARKLQGLYSLSLPSPTTTADTFWLNRMSVPVSEGILTGLGGNAGISGITAYQSFAEWPIVVEAKPTGATTGLSSTTGSTDLAFNLDYSKYQDTATASSNSYGIFAMQAFRAPKGSTDPYDLTIAGWGNASAKSLFTPTAVATTVANYFGTMTTGSVGNTKLAGGLAGLTIPYDANDPDRVLLGSATIRNLAGVRSVFSYSEYLWTQLWAWPLVMNSAQLKFTEPIGASASNTFYRYSVPGTAWPKYTGLITPDNSSFDLNVTGSGTFNPKNVSPVAINGTPVDGGVGRFFWTIYTPWYNAVSGSTIARTWLADASGQPPTAQAATGTTGFATAALGFVPPQDTVVDKRGRNADGSLTGAALGGYRVTWFNATKEEGSVATAAPVPPDFWVVELAISGGEIRHFMLPGSFPATYPTYSPSGLPNPEAIAILTDARVAMTRESDGKQIVAPGYCWFDVPLELRPAAGASATLTVFALKSILKDNAPAGARVLNRPEWIDAIKTATANMSIKSSSGAVLSDIYKIPFNYYWDIVITNGPATPVAP